MKISFKTIGFVLLTITFITVWTFVIIKKRKTQGRIADIYLQEEQNNLLLNGGFEE